MAISTKQTIYIDVDDEITAIIDKVKSAPDKIVALVLPKRATVLQSIVNMKLLKKSAASSKKSLVLITSETGLLPLAGIVGLHVAKSLQSKPEIPLLPERIDAEEAEISDDTSDEPAIDKTKPIGALAANKEDAGDDTETIELDDVKADDVPAAGGKKKSKLSKRFKVPNFDKFRLSFFLVILGVVLLVVGWILAAVVLPKAKVTIVTNTSTVSSSVSFNANTATTALDVEKALIPAVNKEVKKTDTEKTAATGKKDNGARATGIVVFYNCSKSDKLSDTNRTLASGTTVSSGGLNFTITSDVTVQPSSYIGDNCQSNKPSPGVGVTAIKAGTEYNLSAGSTFTTSLFSTISGSNSSALSGGTASVIVSVVSQSDVDAAAAKMKSRLDADAKKELAAQLQTDGLMPLDDTLVISAPAITSAPAVNAEATGDITVTSVTTYNILGVKKDYLSQLIKKDATSKIDAGKQSILDDGLAAAVIHQDLRKSPTEAQLTVQAIVTAGPQLNEATIKDQIRGKKRGDAEQVISSLPGVKDVTIEYSPFWVLSTPKSAKKINIVIQKSETAKTTTGSDNATP